MAQVPDGHHSAHTDAVQRRIGKYDRYPDLTDARSAEGGRRLSNELKTGSKAEPLITVITVCFNAAATLETCIKSVLAQTYPAIEYLIIDGKSNDGTLGILRRAEARLDYYLSEPDGGIYSAMNKGLELARGEYIVFLNADDWYEPDCIEKLVRLKLASKADFVSALARYVDDQGKTLRIQPAAPLDAGADFRMPLRHETMLVPAWLYEEVGTYDENLKIISDRAFTARLYWEGYSHELLSEPLLNFRVSGVSSVNLEGLYAERRSLLVRRYPGLPTTAIDDLVCLEKLSLDRLCAISREYRSAEFRVAAIAYAQSLESQGNKAWQGVDASAFYAAPFRQVQFASEMSDTQAHSASAKPLVSVILPIYNAENTLEACLNSLLAQTLSDIEVICIDDRSPDKSAEIVARFAARDPRIKYYANEANAGLGASRNRGIAVALGEYVFHIDPDDVIPPDALHVLLRAAQKYGSDMVQGAFLHEQMFMGRSARSTRKGMPENSAPIVNATLKSRPEFLASTEGHWSYLYRSSFAKRVFYPEDLKMGQDSIFLAHALSKARSISVIPDVVYHYCANSNSAMNTFNFRKLIDEIEWRFRAWRVLAEAGLAERGEFLLFNYWYPPFFDSLEKNLSLAQKRFFFRKLFYAFSASGNSDLSKTVNPALHQIFLNGIRSYTDEPAQAASPREADSSQSQGLRIAALSTFNKGGAGLASLRCVEGLIADGEHARLYSLTGGADMAHVWNMPVIAPYHQDTFEPGSLYGAWQRVSILKSDETRQASKAREIMSRNETIVDWSSLGGALQAADVIHLHWVAGALDYDHLPEAVANKPVVWTLHDMNPFTGGCHYSEGCEQFKNECQSCALVDDRELPHRAWQQKKRAYEQIENLQLICPSHWLADLARQSSLFKGRPVHVVPNIFPATEFQPVNKIMARIRLGLPLDRKLILFGADDLRNCRKGGDLLQESLRHMAGSGLLSETECICFGSGKVELGVRTHSFGHVGDPARLALIYASADVFAFPSREDNAPQTVIESMLCGTPVVTFPVGYIPDLVQHLDTGYIAKLEDTLDFSNGLRWALDAAQSNAAISRSLHIASIARAYNAPEAAIKRHLEIFEQLPARTPPPVLAEENPSLIEVKEGQDTIYLVTPCFNAADTLEQTILSVLSQAGNFRIHYHLQDGGSTDKTLSILHKWQSRLDSGQFPLQCRGVTFSFTSQKDRGLYDALAMGFAQLPLQPDSFMAWINADDLLLPGTLELVSKVGATFGSEQVSWIGGAACIMRDNTVRASEGRPTPASAIRAGLCDGKHWSFIQQEGVFFRKALWDRAGGPAIFRGLKLAGDWSLWRAFAHYAIFVQTPWPLGVFRKRSGQLSENLSAYMAEIDAIVPADKRMEALKYLGENDDPVRYYLEIDNKEGRMFVIETSAEPQIVMQYKKVFGTVPVRTKSSIQNRVVFGRRD